MGKRDKQPPGIKGMGVGALFGEPVVQPEEPEFPSNQIPLSEIYLPDRQPRRYFDPDKLANLVASIKEHGIIEDLLVRPRDGGGYELVAGERRLRAAQQLNLKTVPVVVRELEDGEALQLALEENLQREDLSPYEEVLGIVDLLALRLNLSQEEVPALLYRFQKEMKGKTAHNVVGQSQEEEIEAVFRTVGRQFNSFVNHRLPILKWPEDILTELQEGTVSFSHAQQLSRLKKDDDSRAQLLEAVVDQKLSVEQTKEQVTQLKSSSTEVANGETPPSPQKRLSNLGKKLKKVWGKTKKRKQIESLLSRLEKLIEEESDA